MMTGFHVNAVPYSTSAYEHTSTRRYPGDYYNNWRLDHTVSGIFVLNRM